MVYKNVEIFIDEKTKIEKGFILVEDGLIKKVKSMKEYDLNYEKTGVKDFNGYKIYPGFIDSHSHIGMWETGLNFAGDDGNEETNPITPHFRAIDAANPKDDAFFKALKAGITTVVTGPGSSNPIGGSFVALKTYGDCVDEMVIKNPVGIKFALGENPKTAYNKKEMTPTTRMGTAALIREELEKAKRYCLKQKKGEQQSFNFKSEALIPLLEGKIKAFFHCHRADDIFTAIRIAKEFNLNFSLVHATEGYLFKEYLKNIDVILGPFISDISKPELKNFSEKSAYVLNKANVTFSICTDHPVFPIEYLNLACIVAIKNGLSKEQAVLAVTKNAAITAGIYDLTGSVEVNKMANFVVFKKDEEIFSPYVEPSFVIIDGKIVFEKF